MSTFVVLMIRTEIVLTLLLYILIFITSPLMMYSKFVDTCIDSVISLCPYCKPVASKLPEGPLSDALPSTTSVPFHSIMILQFQGTRKFIIIFSFLSL